ncbi:MAG: Holliday junction branch migration protein RuvA [bacterium]
MIDFLIGEIAIVKENSVSIDVGGVGYKVGAPTSVTGAMRPGDKGVTLFTTMIATDGNLSLYGFNTPDERDVFEMLITVSGVGPKAGIKLMSLPKGRLLEAIVAEDVAVLTTIPGIGPKTAKRLILDLKDKVSDLFKNMPGGAPAVFIDEGEVGIAAQGLQALGYSASEVRNLLKTLPADDLKTMRAPEIIRRCLQRKD